MTSGSSQGNGPGKPSRDWGLDLLTFPPPGCLPTVESMLPTFQLEEEPPQEKRPRGLFQEMLQGDPNKLSELLNSARDTATVEVSTLLSELQAGTRSYGALSPEEKTLLDQATFHVLSEPAQKRKVQKPFQHVLQKEAEAREEQEWKDPNEESAPTDLQGLPAFWWV